MHLMKAMGSSTAALMFTGQAGFGETHFAVTNSNKTRKYRFPLVPGLDTTISYMAIINSVPDPRNDSASAFSLRSVTAF